MLTWPAAADLIGPYAFVLRVKVKQKTKLANAFARSRWLGPAVTVSLTGPHLLGADPTRMGRGHLVVEAPEDAPIVIHASFAAVQIRDLRGPVRVAATHGRATLLNTAGQVDAVALVVDFAGSGGRVTLSAEAEINMKLSTARFDGTLLAWAQRSVKTLVPPGFLTPFRAVVSRRQDFVCRAEFCSRVTQEKRGDLYYFTYAGDTSVAPEAAMHLRSEQATVVIDTMKKGNLDGGSEVINDSLQTSASRGVLSNC